jgi:hypothetical protein
MVAVVFLNVFRAKIYQNNVFLVFKKLFLKSAHQNDSKHTKKLIFNKFFFLEYSLHRVPKRYLIVRRAVDLVIIYFWYIKKIVFYIVARTIKSA